MSDDLDDLLAELQRPPEIIPAEPAPIAQALPPVQEPELKLIDAAVVPAAPVEQQAPTTPPPTVSEPSSLDILPDPNAELLQKILGNFDASSKEVFDFILSDRKELEAFVQDLRDRIGMEGADPPRILFEALAQALETRANTSLAAVRWLDSRTKLVQALRGGITITNANKGGNQELQQILAAPMVSDFE